MIKKTLIFIFVVIAAGLGGAVVTFFALTGNGFTFEMRHERIIGLSTVVIFGLAAAFLAGRFVLKAWNE